MKKISILLFFMLLFAMGINAYATETMDASIVSETAQVTVSGSIAEKKTLISVRILPENISADTVTPAEIAGNNYVYKTVRTDANGDYGEKIILPDSYKSGIYTVYVNLASKEFKRDITYVNYAQVARFATALNAQTDSSAFAGKFADTDLEVPKKNYEIMVLSDSEYSLFGNNIAQNLYNMKPQTGYTADSLASEYARAYFVNKQNNGFSEDRVKEYADYFGLDYEEEYKNLRTDEKNAFSQNLKSNYSTLKSANTVFWDSLIMARISVSTSYVELKNIFLGYVNYINPSMTDYNSLTNDYDRNNVFGQVYSQKENGYITSVSALKTAFEGFAKSANGNSGDVIIPNENLGNNNSGGGGNGGGSTTSKDEAYTDNYEITTGIDEKEEAKKDAETYSDMVEHWSRNYVYQLSSRGIINGFEDGTFKPERYITRAETVKMIAVMLDMPAYGVDCFTDVSVSDWYYPYVGAAYSSGIAKGTDGKFNPNECITRQDTAVLLYRAVSNRLSSLTQVQFTDSDSISDYAKDAVKALSEAGVITGYNGQFNPMGSTTRGESAAMFSRILKIVEGVQ